MTFFSGAPPASHQCVSLVQSTETTERTVLLTSTCWWPFPTRLALRFASLGWRVEAMCPAHNPLHKIRSVQRFHHYDPFRPLRALSAAVHSAQASLVVPCDDRALGHLLSLQTAEHASATALHPALFPAPLSSQVFLQRRGALIGLAQEAGVRAPDMRIVDTADDIAVAVADFGLPLVLKADSSWGGMGVVIAHTGEAAEGARRRLIRRSGVLFALRSLLINRDPYPLLPSLSTPRPQIYAQRFVRGRPANVAAVGWNGECLARVQVEALLTRDELGASTVVRTIDQPDMARATEILIRRLNISGFCGFDFMIEDETGDAHLIEMNPRATPTSHLALGCGRDLVAALDMKLQNLPLGAPPSQDAAIVALFPDAWQHTPKSVYLTRGHHDVPWQEPELVREMVRVPYPDRGAVARLWSICRA